MKKSMILILALGFSCSTFAGNLTNISVADFIKVAECMKRTEWSENQTIESLSKNGENSFSVVTKAYGKCSSAEIDDLGNGILYVVASSIEDVSCSK